MATETTAADRIAARAQKRDHMLIKRLARQGYVLCAQGIGGNSDVHALRRLRNLGLCVNDAPNHWSAAVDAKPVWSAVVRAHKAAKVARG